MKIKFISILGLISIFLSGSVLNTTVKGIEYINVQNSIQQTVNDEGIKFGKKGKIFNTEDSANEYYNELKNEELKKSKIHTGIHQVQDDVGNNYYWENNNDLGNPSQGGYGDMKTYYKNGSTWKFKYDDKYVVDSSQFIVLNDDYKSIKAQTILFCIEPLKIAEWIDNDSSSSSNYNDLSKDIQKKINVAVSYSTKLFSQTGNFDYLSAGQLKVWEVVGATNIEVPNSLKVEWDNLNQEIQNHSKIPSFTVLNTSSIKTHTLTYNPKRGRYEITLHDSNNVLDSRYLSDIKGTYGNYHVEDGSGVNNLYVWVDKTHGNTGKSSVVTSKYDPMPASGTKVGVHYTSTPTFANSGQDLVAGVSDPIEVKVQFDVKEAKGSVDLKKTEDDSGTVNGNTINNPLSGAEFTLFKSDGTKVASKVTETNGYLKFDDLSLGEYYVTETKAPTGYKINEKKYNFEIFTDGQIVHINNGEVRNEVIKGRAVLQKVEDDSSAINGNTTNSDLSGAEFTVYDSKNSVVEKIYSDSKGEVNTGFLSYGKYKIVETKAPTGYLLGDYEEEFEITKNQQVVELNRDKPLKNYIIKGGITLNKVGENFDNNDNNLYDLSGAEFTVTDSQGKVVETMITDKNGYGEIENLKYGTYTVTETKAPIGYINSGYSEVVNIDKNGEIVQLNTGGEIINEVIKGKVHLHKVGETFDNEDSSLYSLAGAEFTIYSDLNKDGILDENETTQENIIDVLITDENGNITSHDLKWGNYIIKERKAPEGYVNGGYEEPFVIAQNGEVIELLGGMDLVNDVIKGKVDLTKVGETNSTSHQCRSLKPDCDDSKPLLGEAEFTISTDLNANGIFDDEDTQIETITTNQSGYAESSDLKYGTYTIVETKAPIGYLINDTIFKFEITKDGEIVHINNDNPVIDVADKRMIHIKKEDQNGQPVVGAEFTITTMDKKSGDKVVDVLTTDENGETTSKPLTFGKYAVAETKAPTGYILDDTPKFFTITNTDSQDELTFNFENTKIEGTIEISKTDQKTEELLSGAEFTLYNDSNGNKKLDKKEKTKENIVEVLITNEKGSATTKKLKFGNYILCETKAPSKYYLPKNNQTALNISKPEEKVKVNITNQRIQDNIVRKLAQTGQDHINFYLKNYQKIIFLLILTATIIVMYLLKKKKSLNNKKNYI